MDAGTPQRISEPCFTTKGEGTDKDKGTGLGRATVFEIVRRVKGGISVASRLGDSTTFPLFLPVHEHPPELPVADAA